MTKFEKFADFIIHWVNIPIFISLILNIACLGISLFMNKEFMWLVYITYAALFIMGIWILLFMVSTIGVIIITHIQNKRFTNNLDKMICEDCDCMVSEDIYQCKSCVHGSNYSNVLISAESEE